MTYKFHVPDLQVNWKYHMHIYIYIYKEWERGTDGCKYNSLNQ